MSDDQDQADLYKTLFDLNNKKNPDSPLYQNGQDTNFNNSVLYKTLLQQSMNQPQSPGIGGVLTKMLGAYMGMGGGGFGQGAGIANASYSMGGGD